MLNFLGSGVSSVLTLRFTCTYSDHPEADHSERGISYLVLAFSSGLPLLWQGAMALLRARAHKISAVVPKQGEQRAV